MSPSTLYRVVSVAEAITWSILILGMILKYVIVGTDVLVRVGGPVHGFAFLCFVVVTLITAVNAQWKVGEVIVGLGSAIVPWATIAFDRWAHRRGLVPGHWRLAHGDAARTGGEKVIATLVRRPIASAVVAIIGISIVFATLLWLGPPTEWGRG